MVALGYILFTVSFATTDDEKFNTRDYHFTWTPTQQLVAIKYKLAPGTFIIRVLLLLCIHSPSIVISIGIVAIYSTNQQLQPTFYGKDN